MSVLAPPRSPDTPTSVCYLAAGDDDDDGRLCHTLDAVTELPLCGKRLPAGRGRGGIHTTSNPLLDPCDGCGTPRCPACAALCSRRG